MLPTFFYNAATSPKGDTLARAFYSSFRLLSCILKKSLSAPCVKSSLPAESCSSVGLSCGVTGDDTATDMLLLNVRFFDEVVSDSWLVILVFTSFGCSFYSVAMTGSGSGLIPITSFALLMYSSFAFTMSIPFLALHASHLALAFTFHMPGRGMFTSPTIACLYREYISSNFA